LKSITYNKSNRDSLYTRFKYSFDLLGALDPTGAHQNLFNHNDLSTIIAEEISLGKNVEPLEEKFNKMSLKNNIIRLDSVMVKKKKDLWETRIVYRRYDSKGNVEELSKKNGAS